MGNCLQNAVKKGVFQSCITCLEERETTGTIVLWSVII